ncbi:hypothetical protein Tco_1278001 [Tanacetum coccineum]
MLGVRGNVKGIGRGYPRSSGSSGSPRSRWVTKDQRDILLSIKPGDIVFNPQPDFEFNRTTIQVLKCTDNVKDTYKVSVFMVVGDKVDVGKKPAEVVKDTALVNDKLLSDVVKDKAQVDVVLENMQDVVSDKVQDDVVKNKAPDVVKHKASAVGKKKPAGNVAKDMSPVKDKVHSDVVKDKAQVDVVSVVKGNLAVDDVSDKVHDDVVKDKASDVVKHKVPDVVKKKSVNVKEKSTGVKEKATSVKQKSIDVVENSIGVLDKFKPEVKPKAVVRVLRSKETLVKRKMNLLKEVDSKKKLKVMLLKGKSEKQDSSSSLESDEVDSLSDEVDRKSKKLKI